MTQDAQEAARIWLQAIDRAPHDDGCAVQDYGMGGPYPACTCWKADVL